SSPLSYPLHFRDAELEEVEMEYNPRFLWNILPRIEWEALRVSAATKPEPRTSASTSTSPSTESSIQHIAPPTDTNTMVDMDTADPPTDPNLEQGKQEEEEKDESTLRDLHKLLLETQVVEGKLVCGNCGHEYRIKEGIANFLLPNHLV
ncbi:MAG: hypothetical protein Q9187_003754, partial [Circinaria calcarea]